MRVNPQIAKTLAILQRKLDVLDAAHQTERLPLVTAIKGLQEFAGESRDRAVHKSSPPAAPKISRERATWTRVSTKVKKTSPAKLILEAVYAQTDAFTTVDIRAYLDTRHPAASGKISSKRISKELYSLRKGRANPVIRIFKEGVKGGPNSYRVISLPD